MDAHTYGKRLHQEFLELTIITPLLLEVFPELDEVGSLFSSL
jgi:hypothetical protein